jgi:hypothetical protein
MMQGPMNVKKVTKILAFQVGLKHVGKTVKTKTIYEYVMKTLIKHTKNKQIPNIR